MKKVFIKRVNFCRSVRFFVPIFNCVNPDPIWIHCTDYITVTNKAGLPLAGLYGRLFGAAPHPDVRSAADPGQDIQGHPGEHQ